jgi:hypothetical protein
MYLIQGLQQVKAFFVVDDTEAGGPVSTHTHFDSVSFDSKAVNHNCKLYGHGGYSTAHVPGVHHLYATNPPTIAPDHFENERCSTECPAADGQIFASPTGEVCVLVYAIGALYRS